MTLVLTLTNGGGSAGSVKTFDRRGGTIGRNPDNDWVLPDPERIVGRVHCRIDFDGVAYLLTDISTNGVFVNGASSPLGRDRQIILQEGDRLQIGDYLVGVSVRHGPAAPVTPPVSGPLHAASPRHAPDADDPFGLNDFPEQHAPTDRVTFDAKMDDGFADAFEGWGDSGSGGLFGDPSPARSRPAAAVMAPPATQPDHHPVETDALNLPPIGDGAPTIPDLDDLDDLLESIQREAQGGTLGAAAAEPALATPPPMDGLDDPFGLDPLPAAPPPAAAEPPPAPAAPPGPAMPAAAEPAAARAPGPGDAAVLAALLRGLGLDAAALGGVDGEQLARHAGETLRRLVEGLRDVLTARAMARNELRIKGTVIGAQQNNPLKLAPTPESALRQLVGRTEPGYMAPDAALDEAIEDLKAHQLAMLAGMQRAIASLLERFAPERLIQDLDHQPMLAAILPAARKAAYWEAYEKTYRKIATEAEEDFNAVFGREFARAYEEQADRLRSEGDAARRQAAGGRG